MTPRHREPAPARAQPIRKAVVSALALVGLVCGPYLAFGGTDPAPAPLAAIAADEEPVYVSRAAPVDFSYDQVSSISGRHAEEEARIISAASPPYLTRPLPGATVTSPFTDRLSPISGAAEFHNGMDLAGACSTPVHPAADGTVVFAGPHNGTGGNRVEILHSGGVITTYSHLSSISARMGERIGAADAVGEVGSTGASTGCHLHFEVWVDGKAVDPADWL